MTEAQVVKLEKAKIKVEILAKPGKVTLFREGKCGFDDALIDDRVYSNSSRGEVASEGDQQTFGCVGRELVELILRTGKYSLTAQEKRDAVEQRRVQVVRFIHENFVDANSRPHPITRIEQALLEVRAQYDPDQEAERIARSLIPKLQPIIRLNESQIEGTAKIPNAVLGQCIGICYNLGKVQREEYGPENAFIDMVVSPAKFDELVGQLGAASAGRAGFSIKGALASGQEDEDEERKVKHKAKGGNAGKGRKGRGDD